MKNIKFILFTSLFAFFAIMFSNQAFAQSGDEALNSVKGAIKAGSAKDVARYFNTAVEVGVNGDKASYSQAQAEFVLRDFFSKNPVSGFEYLHQGSSNEGQKYAIGKYTSKTGSYRVFVVVKQFGGSYKIDTIDFAKE
jgi:hypothetical protein